jgi:hypothetical protein
MAKKEETKKPKKEEPTKPTRKTSDGIYMSGGVTWKLCQLGGSDRWVWKAEGGAFKGTFASKAEGLKCKP